MASIEEQFKALVRLIPWYWIRVLLAIGLSFAVTPFLDKHFDLIEIRNRVHQYLEKIDRGILEPRYNTRLLYINDDEFWKSGKGDLAGRRPIKRDYLARLFRAVSEADAAIIALDFDMRSPDPNRDEIPFDYQDETKELVETILDVAKKRIVVLPKTVVYDSEGTAWLEPDFYDSYGLCDLVETSRQWRHTQIALPIAERQRKNIRCGYILLPPDKRLLPGNLKLGNGGFIDSFGHAVAKASDPERIHDDPTRYGSYITEKEFEKDGTILSASEVLKNPDFAHDKLAAKLVIIGAHWHTLASDRGDFVDIHSTPVGPLPGALIHANFVEAFLDGRTYGFTRDWLVPVSDIFLGLIAAAIFAFYPRFLNKLVILLALSVSLLVIELFALHFLGLFFDAFVVLFGVWLHSIGESLIPEW
jgi:CHASE2 domain-containing sensor protein